MVSYSAWQEAPDYLQFHTVFGGSDATDPDTGLPLFEYGTGSQIEETEFQDPRYEITVPDLEGVTEGSHDFEVQAGSLTATWGTAYSWGYDLSIQGGVSLWRSMWAAANVKRRFRIADRDYFFNPPNYGYTAPPGAIGIDYEGLPYDPSAYAWRSGPATKVSRALSSAAPTVLRGPWWEEVNGAYVGVPAGSTQVVFRADGSDTEQILATLGPPVGTPGVDAEATKTLPGDIDLTGLLDPDLWSGVLWTRPSPIFVPPITDPSEINQVEVRYGWGFENVRIDTIVRPPRWRWVFDSTPIQQTSHRDDHLAGGAYQTWPAPTSRQLSNTTFGGYL